LQDFDGKARGFRIRTEERVALPDKLKRSTIKEIMAELRKDIYESAWQRQEKLTIPI
jgi:hypothetical protein